MKVVEATKLFIWNEHQISQYGTSLSDVAKLANNELALGGHEP